MRRTRSAWLLVGCLTATVLGASALVSALVTFYSSALTGAVTSELTQAGAAMSIAVSGELTGPPAPRPGQPIPAALPATAAADLGLHLGSVFPLRDLASGRQVTLWVSGLYRAERPTAAYWQIDLIGTGGVTVGGGFASYGPAVVSPAVFGRAGTSGPLIVATQASFVVLPQVASITPAELMPLASRITAMTSPVGWIIVIAAGLPAVPVLAAAVVAVRRPDPAAELRAAEAVV